MWLLYARGKVKIATAGSTSLIMLLVMLLVQVAWRYGNLNPYDGVNSIYCFIHTPPISTFPRDV